MAKKKPKLPKYVVLKFGQWHVRRVFPTHKRDELNKIVYLQISRRCVPETPERALQLSAEIESLVRHTDSAATVEGLIEQFMVAKKSSVTPYTHENYWRVLQQKVENTAFGATPLSRVTPIDVQRFYAKLIADGRSDKIVRKVHKLLSMAFRQGRRWELIDRNPCEGAVLPRHIKPEISIMTQAEVRKFMSLCIVKYPVLAFALETGARPGEYLALEWKDIDLEKQHVTIRRSVSHNLGGGFEYKEPKTAKSRRTIDLSETMCQRLKKMRKRSGLVFPSRSGTPIIAHNLSQRTMKQACTEAGIGDYTLYSLRHASASLALVAGADLKAVSERLGHADVSVTLNVYQSVLPSLKHAVTAKLSGELYDIAA